MNEDLLYMNSIQQIDLLRNKLLKEKIDIERIMRIDLNENIQNLNSNLDFFDLVFAIVFGIIGANLSTNYEIAEFSKKIHDYTYPGSKKSLNKLQIFLGRILEHHGDKIDYSDETKIFKNRAGNNADGLFHRLYWGHDILSISSDNPISLMCKDNGILLGIIKTLRHLISDTCSKQGLPLPGSSFFDYTNSDGKVSNYILDIVKKAVEESNNGKNDRILMQEYYRHAFTIRMQDVMSQGFVYACSKAYFIFRDINNPIRQKQYKTISYITNFLTHALIGAVKQNGFPYINWTALMMTIKEITGLVSDSNKITNRLAVITEKIIDENFELIQRGNIIEKRVLKTSLELDNMENSLEFIQMYFKEEESSMDIIDIFEED